MQTFTATYSPDDNKIRLTASSRLDQETYARVKGAGFAWAPHQEMFIAPKWTPGREDLALELAGEIDDEDSTLMDRAEDRAGRFDDYHDKRETEANSARQSVERITSGIPLGQPILVGHHSERHARRDAEKIENGMRKAVQLWETSKYWTYRAAAAIRHAKYKERPDVRARRIKGIEADARKVERTKKECALWLKLWSVEGLTHEQALAIANRCWLHLPRKEGDREDFQHTPTAYDALTNAHPTLYAPRTLEEIVQHATQTYPATMRGCDRWLTHYANRLEYEKAMLQEQGGADLLKPKPRRELLPLLNYRQAEFVLPNRYGGRGNETITYPQIDMTQKDYTDTYSDYKATRTVENSHRIRTVMKQHSLYSVFLTDAKAHRKPTPQQPTPSPDPTPPPLVLEHDPEPPHQPAPVLMEHAGADTGQLSFDQLKDTLRTGVQIVSAQQLFPTPPDLARQMVDLADMEAGQGILRILEPSAGIGNLIDPIWNPDARITAVETNHALADQLKSKFPAVTVKRADFLDCNGNLGTFDRIIMNPPFQHADDIKHILHARTFLKPGGLLVALCANGPRQNDTLKPLADTWEDLPAGSFADHGTNVRVALLTMKGA